jgi:hypothetical protein
MSASRLKVPLSRCFAALLCGLMMASAFGQQASREQEQLRRLRLQVQRLQQDQAAQRDAAQRADAEKAATATERDAAAAERDAARIRLRAAVAASATEQQRAEAAEKLLAAAQRDMAAASLRIGQLQTDVEARGRDADKLRTEVIELQRRLADGGAAYADLQQRHVRQAEGLQICIASNQALRDIGLDLLQRYAGKTVAEVLAQDEPFLQFQRVKLENLLQDYEDKLDRQAVRPVPGSSSAGRTDPVAAGVPQRAP